jgi:hypothetical protein
VEPGSPFGAEIAPLAARYGEGYLYLAAPTSGTLEGGGLRLADVDGERELLGNAASFSVDSAGHIAATSLSPSGSSVLIVDEGGEGVPDEWLQRSQPLAVLAWLGDRLLALETFGETEPPNLLLVARSGVVKEWPASSLLAVAPDGKSFLIDTVDNETGDNRALVVAAESLEIIGSVKAADLPPSSLVVGQSEWSTKGLFASIWIDGEAHLGLFVALGNDLVLEKSVRLPEDILFGLVHPTFDPKSGIVDAWAWSRSVLPTSSGGFDRSPYLRVSCEVEQSSCSVTGFGQPSGQVSLVFSRSR